MCGCSPELAPCVAVLLTADGRHSPHLHARTRDVTSTEPHVDKCATLVI